MREKFELTLSRTETEVNWVLTAPELELGKIFTGSGSHLGDVTEVLKHILDMIQLNSYLIPFKDSQRLPYVIKKDLGGQAPPGTLRTEI